MGVDGNFKSVIENAHVKSSCLSKPTVSKSTFLTCLREFRDDTGRRQLKMVKRQTLEVSTSLLRKENSAGTGGHDTTARDGDAPSLPWKTR